VSNFVTSAPGGPPEVPAITRERKNWLVERRGKFKG
jgi:hypothetical protein